MLILPSIAHLVLGGVFGICLYYLTSGKFSKKHVFILFLNNYLGPDTGWAVGLGYYTHTLIGWFFYAFLLAIFYYYFTRFTIEYRKNNGIELKDLKKPTIPYINTYFVVLAGGIMHQYLDNILNYGGVYFIIPQFLDYEGLTWDIGFLMTFWAEGIIKISPILSVSIGILFIIGFIYVFTWFLKKYSLKSGIIAILHITVFMIFFYLIGNITTGEHSDAGAIIYVSIYWLIPIILIALSTKPLKLIRKEEKPLKRSEKNIGLIISKWMYLILGIFIIILGIALLYFKESLFESLLKRGYIDMASKEQMLSSFTIISIVIIGIGALIFTLWLKIRKIELHHKNFLIISMWLCIIGLVAIILSLLGILLNEVFVQVINSAFGILYERYVTYEEATIIVTIFGIIILILGIINFIIAVGLTFKNRFLWRFSIYYHLILAWTIIGLTISCALSENEVKEFFESRS